jgi:hypothetical protein
MAMGSGLDGPTSIPVRIYIFLLPAFAVALRPTQPYIKWIPGAISKGVKWPELQTHQLYSPIAQVKETWIYTSTPSYVFIA